MKKNYNKAKAFSRSDIDRRSGNDRRQDYNLNYFEENNSERRSHIERRYPHENRLDWVRYSQWQSVFVGDYPDEIVSEDEDIIIYPS